MRLGATLVIVVLGSGVQAQAGQGVPFAHQSQAQGNQRGVQSRGPVTGVPQPIQLIPSSPILPMSNPVAPMSNPIAPMSNPVLPIMPQAFIRYGEIPTVVIPTAPAQSTGPAYIPPRGGRGRPGYPNRGGYQAGVVVQPQGTFRGEVEESQDPSGSVRDNRSDFAGQETPQTPEVITPDTPEQPRGSNQPRPRPRPAPPAPAIGTPRAEVLQNLGNPWGRFSVGGAESLYFDGGLVVVLTEGRVSQIGQ